MMGGHPVPSRRVLEQAEQYYAETGDELRGFLSESAGFLPHEPIPTELPSSHRAWDEIAAALPQLWRQVAFRKAAEDLPLLRATRDDLSERDVRRASTILGYLAHSYVRSELSPMAVLPPPLQQPWEDLAARLHRPETFLQYEDIILGNWRPLDAAGPLVVDNLEMLVATLRIQAETVFHLGQVEMHALATPMVGAVVRAQEAVQQRDTDALEAELLVLIDVVRALLEQTFIKIDPNAYSRTHVDPVLWGALIAPFAVSLKAHLPGPGGTSSPIFHTLDGLLGRDRFESFFGHEAMRLRQYGPPFVNDFFAAVAEVPVREAVESSGSRRLQGVLQTLVDVYAGKRGLIAAHRLKAYGFLEMAFKVGRPVTISGVGGSFHDRPWIEVDEELESSRRERAAIDPNTAQLAALALREPTDPQAVEGVKHVVLDIADRGILYRTGDRCGVLPVNEERLVQRTIAALKATGSEQIQLTRRWRAAVRHRPGFETATELPLVEFLRFAKLRPVLRPVAKELQRLASSEALRDVVEARREDQWELWDVLELVARDGYDVTRLWRAEAWQDESIAAVVPPEDFRMYSVSSRPDEGDDGFPAQLHLTVGTLEYRSAEGGPDPPVTRRGSASVFLNETAPPPPAAIPIEVVHPLRFHLPADPATPIAMFAGGTGISPFRGFIEDRAAQPGAGDTRLFLAARTRAHLYYRDELARFVTAGALDLDVAFSGEDIELRAHPGRAEGAFEFVPGTRARIDAVMERDDNARALWDLMRRRDEGGDEGVIYVCGQAGFAQTVLTSLYRIAERFLERDQQTGHGAAADVVRRLMADRRLMLDVFTTFVPAMGPGVLGSDRFDASEVVLHNDDEHGYWIVVSGNVYDMTEFRYLHPGGRHIVDASAGMDATREYQIVAHHENSEIDAMLSMYKIGAVRRLDFKTAWGIALTSDGLTYVSVQDLFRSWVRFLYLVVEMENAFKNDVLYLRSETSIGEDATALSPLKLMMMGNTHARFMQLYYKGLLGDDIHNLWALTVGLCAVSEDAQWLRGELDRLEASEGAQQLRALESTIRDLYREWRDGGAAGFEQRAAGICEAVREQDHAFLRSLKMTLRRGVQVFEQHEGATIQRGGETLIEVLRAIPDVVATFHRDFCDAFASVNDRHPPAALSKRPLR